MKKVIVFVDGNNWYHNVKRYYNPSEVDIIKVIDLIKKIKEYSVLEIRWYVSVPSIEDGEKMYFKHLSFLDHLKNNSTKQPHHLSPTPPCLITELSPLFFLLTFHLPYLPSYPLAFFSPLT